jgi:MarR-like DNA-binding transcriptional regulator SgrR of sgrS sRNA
MKTYKFKITHKQNNAVIGTGSFKVSKEMNEVQKLSFFHEYTSKAYLNKTNFLNIEFIN